MRLLWCFVLTVCIIALTGCQREVEALSSSMVEQDSSQMVSQEEESSMEQPSASEPEEQLPDPEPAKQPESSDKADEPEEVETLTEFPPLLPASPAPDLPAGAPRLEMAVREFHQQNLDQCIVEIPRIEGAAEEANASLEALTEEWTEFKESQIHGGLWMEIRTLPYVNRKWVQVVVHHVAYPNSIDYGNNLSVNYELETNRIVSVEEMLERMSLTPEILLEKLRQVDLRSVICFFYDIPYQVNQVEVQAFRGREDGSALFYLRPDIKQDGVQDVWYLLTYDTRDGSFLQFRGDRPGSYRDPPNLSDPPLQWEADVEREKEIYAARAARNQNGG